jgi:hypothetical protein
MHGGRIQDVGQFSIFVASFETWGRVSDRRLTYLDDGRFHRAL